SARVRPRPRIAAGACRPRLLRSRDGAPPLEDGERLSVHPRALPLQRHEPRPGRHDLRQRYSRLVRGAIVLLAGLAFTASANAAPPAVTATASPAAGVAPFRVTLTAAGDAATYTWGLSDG